MANPFRIGEHVKGEFFTDREAEKKQVRTALLTPSRLLVYGPRRMGKSSVIGWAAESARSARPKPIVVGADLSTATSLFDVASRLLRSLYAETRWLKLRLEDLLGALGPRVRLTLDEASGAPSISFGIERRTASEEDRRRALESVFERLESVRSSGKRPVALVLDEFQAIGSLGGESGEWHLRDLMQRHGELSYICAGSEQSLIEEMMGPRRAFFRMFELLHLGPIDEAHLAGWIEERMRLELDLEDEVGLEIVRRAGPRTQDVIQVARQLWFRGVALERPVQVADVPAALDDVVAGESPLIATLWTGLSAQQQDVLRAVALDVEQLFSTEVRDRYGLPAASSLHTAAEALIGRGLLVRDEGRIRFDSPFVRRWVRREVAADIG